LIQAAGQLHGDFELAIVGDVVGDGRDRENLSVLARELGVADKVRWAGWQASPWTAVENVDVVVLSSAFEGFPMVLVEAMSRGIPCISSNCETGPDDIVVPDGNGWLYPPGDVEALRALMQRIIDDRSILPPAEAVAASVQKFSIEAMMSRFNSALKTVTG
jgi:UDP-D-galactose:(glucosyl)LPS alpha-1,6-D-galactosyltransferase